MNELAFSDETVIRRWISLPNWRDLSFLEYFFNFLLVLENFFNFFDFLES